MARQPSFNPIKEWKNFHESYEQVIEGEYDLFMPQQTAGLTVEDMKETTHQFQALIADARKKGLKARAVGSAWSLSRAPTTTGWALNTNRLRGRLKVPAADLDGSYPGTADQKAGLYLFQCGNTVADVNKVLESKDQRRSLFTSGAANGQTIAGATSCGTHGSALDHKALHDHIVAIHLIATGDSHFWIERKSRPVMSAAWVKTLGATLRRDDDDLFNAAVVAFGSFGIIQAVVIESVPRYLLETQPGQEKLDENLWKAIGALDFTAHPFFKEGRPYFFQAVINPATDEVLLNANYKRKDDDRAPTYGLTQDPKAIGPGFDFLVHRRGHPRRVQGAHPRFLGACGQAIVRHVEEDRHLRPDLRVQAASAPRRQRQHRGRPARRAQGAGGADPALQGYRPGAARPRLPLRAEIAGPARLQHSSRRRWRSASTVSTARARAPIFAAAADRLEAAGIAYTQHWGKVNAYTKERVLKAYGGNVAKWLKARRQVLPDDKDRAVFDNAYIEERGLAG